MNRPRGQNESTRAKVRISVVAQGNPWALVERADAKRLPPIRSVRERMSVAAARIRPATEGDAGQCLAIYGPIVRQTAISFEVEPPTEREMRQRIAATVERFPWLVCEQHGEVLGYACASQHRVRAAYRWSVEVSVYVNGRVQGLGIGRGLYSSLFQILALQGFCNAYAGITLPNPASVRVHEALGFQPVGVYRAVGYKLGAWHDVGWWQLSLGLRSDPPETPTNFKAIRERAEYEAALTSGGRLLRVV